MFKKYQSKPTTRLAHKTTEKDKLIVVDENTMKIDLGSQNIAFKHHEEVNVGDYVCFISHADIYHCNAQVFAERNIIGDENV